MAAGVIYILVTPTNRQLLKIGKTTRTAEERAEEISRGTGVPAPYWVAYDDAVLDCDKAESLIHQRLIEFRYTGDREFFRLPLKKAIPVVMQVIEEVNAELKRPIRRASDAKQVAKSSSRRAPKEVDGKTLANVIVTKEDVMAKAMVTSTTKYGFQTIYGRPMRSSKLLTKRLPIAIPYKSGLFTKAVFEEGDCLITRNYIRWNDEIHDLKDIKEVYVVCDDQVKIPEVGKYQLVLENKDRYDESLPLMASRDKELVLKVFDALTTKPR